MRGMGRLGVFVRIRIYGIGGIFRISLAQFAIFAIMGIPPRGLEMSACGAKARAGRILKIL